MNGMMMKLSPTAGQAEIMIAKHRNGSIENVRLKFIGHLGKFDNLDYSSYDDLPSSMNQEDNSFITKIYHLPMMLL
jgi:replicative DNA helicase